ncbi:MAG: DUF4347 domain-containing protein [Rhodospirillales bacterium]|nr:MAG: DUF4347 domain-containing protein [Rhodospirillales bacterium]
MKRAESVEARHKGASRPLILALEPRFMFDGAAADTAASDLSHNDTQQTAEPQAKHEIVFIDSSVTDWQSLAEGLRDGVEVHVLDADRDGLQQIAEVLAGRSDVDSIHIISHGAEGQVQIGATILSLSNMDSREAELSLIGQSLSAGGDILLYGCNVGQDAIGSAFIGHLGELTGADVAASTDATGLSGNWVLEQSTGQIEASVAVTDAAQAAYSYSLDFPVGGGGTTGASYGYGVAVDSAGNVYTTGYFWGTVDFDPGDGVTNLTSASNDIFIQKFDSAGNLLWVKTIGNASNEVGNGIAVDGSGNVYVTGYFNGTVDFDPGAGATELTSAGASDAFVLKLNSAGTLVWAKAMGGTGSDGGNGIAVDGSGNVYVTGSFNGTVDFDPGTGTANLTSAGSTDIFVQKLDSTGALVWAKAMGGTGSDVGNGIAVDGSGNVYTTGSFSATADFDPGNETTELTSAGITDIFIQKLDSTGALVWARAMGSTTADEGSGIAVDGSGNVYVTGSYSGSMTYTIDGQTVTQPTRGGSEIIVQKWDSNGDLVWLTGPGGSQTDKGKGIAVDGSGNVYVVGSFYGTADFQPGFQTTDLTSTGLSDIFVLKLSSAGALVWVKSMGGLNGETAGGIALDGSGNVYTTGYFVGLSDFDPGAGTTTLSTVGNNPAMFVQKLASTGTLAWAKATQSSGAAEAKRTVTDADGNIYVVGSFSGTIDFDPGAGVTALTSNEGKSDIFVLKLDSTGALVWAKAMGGTSNDFGNGIAVDEAGNVYVTGYFSGTGDFDPGAGTTTLTSAGVSDVFALKLNSSGALVWAKAMGGTAADQGKDIAVDGSGNVYITGNFDGTADFDPGTGTSTLTSAGISDIFVLKLNASGALVWAKAMGSTSSDDANAIAVEGSGNVYTIGVFSGTVDFDPGTGTTALTSMGGASDIFIQKLDSTGTLVWAKAMGGTNSDTGTGIALDGSGNVYTTGSFYGTVDFDPGTGTTALTSMGGPDIFVQKLDSTGALIWAKAMGGNVIDNGYDIAVDGSGNVYTTGSFYGTVDFDPGTGTTALTSAGNTDIFVQKLDSTGSLVWAKAMGGTGNDVGSGIAVTNSGRAYFAGSFTNTADFDPGPETQTLVGGSNTGFFVSTLYSSGDFTRNASATNASTNEDTQSSSGLVLSGNDASLTYFQITNISGGKLYKNDGVSEIVAGSFITLAEGNAGLKFTPTLNSTASGSFQVQASTSNGAAGLVGSAVTATVTVTAVNDAPSLSANMPLTAVAEDSTAPSGATIASLAAQVTFTDVDASSSLGGFAIIGNSADATTEGVWQYSTDGTTWHAVGSVADDATALALSAAAKLRFVPVANYNGTPPALSVRALDNSYAADWTSGATRISVDTTTNGGATAIAGTARTVGTSITAVNDAPSLSDNMILAAVPQGTTEPTGETIANLVGTVIFSDIDAASSLGGFAIIGNTATEGVWQYSTDGTTWHAVGNVADGSTALALSATTKLRFVPAAGYAGTPPALSVRALDNTYAVGWTNGATRVSVDTTTNGGATAIAGTVRTVGTSITPTPKTGGQSPAPSAPSAPSAPPVAPVLATTPPAPLVTVVRSTDSVSFVAASTTTGNPGEAPSTTALVMTVEAARTQVNFTVPGDTFASIRTDGQMQMAATMVDGSALPGWLNFNPQTGTFVGQPPAGLTGEMVVRVIARDQNGREVVVNVRINVNAGGATGVPRGQPQGQGEGEGEAQGETPQAPEQQGEASPEVGAPIIKLSDFGKGQTFAGKPAFQDELRMASRLAGARQAQLLAAARAVARNA